MDALVEYWRNEAHYIDVAVAVGDEITAEYGAKAIETANALEQADTEITQLREQVEVMRGALVYYAKAEHYESGDVPCHIYIIDDHGRTATQALSKAKEIAG